MLFQVFLGHLGHLDSYIYLASVNGLSALADYSPDQVVPQLCKQFMSKCSSSETPSQESGILEIVLKVGEALVKAVKRMGNFEYIQSQYFEELVSFH